MLRAILNVLSTVAGLLLFLLIIIAVLAKTPIGRSVDAEEPLHDVSVPVDTHGISVEQ